MGLFFFGGGGCVFVFSARTKTILVKEGKT